MRSKLEIVGDAQTAGLALSPAPVCGYVRVSKEDERVQTLSPGAQASLIRQYASLHGMPEPYVISERASAKNIHGRPELLRLLAMCRSGQTKHIIVVDLTRLFREVRGGLEAFDNLERQGVTVHSAASGSYIDASTADGKFMLTLHLAFGERERMLISERTKRALLSKPPIPFKADDNAAMRDKALRGKRRIGGAQWGYQWIGRKEKRRLVPVQMEMDGLHLIHAMRVNGGSWRSIVDALYETGYRTRSGKPCIHYSRVLCATKTATYKEMTTMASHTERQAAFFLKCYTDPQFCSFRGQKPQNVAKMVEEDKKAGTFYDPDGKPLFDVDKHYPPLPPKIV